MLVFGRGRCDPEWMASGPAVPPEGWRCVYRQSCVLQLWVLAFGERCLVQGSAGSLETLT